MHWNKEATWTIFEKPHISQQRYLYRDRRNEIPYFYHRFSLVPSVASPGTLPCTHSRPHTRLRYLPAVPSGQCFLLCRRISTEGSQQLSVVLCVFLSEPLWGLEFIPSGLHPSLTLCLHCHLPTSHSAPVKQNNSLLWLPAHITLPSRSTILIQPVLKPRQASASWRRLAPDSYSLAKTGYEELGHCWELKYHIFPENLYSGVDSCRVWRQKLLSPLDIYISWLHKKIPYTRWLIQQELMFS